MVHAEIKTIDRIPRLMINGAIEVPISSFVNGDVTSYDLHVRTIQKAAAAGIHLHQCCSGAGRYAPDKNGNFPDETFAGAKAILDSVLEGDPQGKIVLRFFIGDYYHEFSKQFYSMDDVVCFYDSKTSMYGDTKYISIASDTWFELAKNRMRSLIRFLLRDEKYANSVIGYLPTAADAGEWFQCEERNYGVDLSPVNSRKFQQWVRAKYQSKDALQKAWHDDTITFDSVEVPKDFPGGKGWCSNLPDRDLYIDPADRRFIDYGDYYSEMTAGRIEEIARIIKEESKGNQLAFAFYGYSLAMFDAKSGHCAAGKLLNSSYIDGLAAPVNYILRNEGASGCPQGLSDSVIAHGKLWWDECDYRSPIVTKQVFGTDNWERVKTLPNLIEIYKRHLGMNILSGSAAWIMDLPAFGWYDNQLFWDAIGSVKKLYLAYMKHQSLTPHDIAYIYDEAAMSVNASVDVTWSAIVCGTDGLFRSGISFGLYSMDDLLEGRLDECKVYIFLNPYRIEHPKAKIIKDKLKNSGKTAVFLHHFGLTLQNDVKMLTGMDIADCASPNPSVSLLMPEYQYAIADETTEVSEKIPFERVVNLLYMSADFDVRMPLAEYIPSAREMYRPFIHKLSRLNPNSYIQNPEDCTVVGTNYQTKDVTFAYRKLEGYTAVFYSNPVAQNPALYRFFARLSGAHTYCASNDVILVRNNMLVIHASSAGVKHIHLPHCCDAYDYFEGIRYQDVTEVDLTMCENTTRYLFFGEKPWSWFI